ncbi:MAG TPA: hypothetical protein VFU22_20760 [Roseiflexaceae bacterium]|nr:hypothetical protein [Roseiflexaceae bacterium]
MKSFTRIAALVVLALTLTLACGGPAATLAQSPLIGGCPIFPSDNVWNTPIDTLPADARSAAYMSSIGANVAFHPDFGSDPSYGIPYTVVSSGQAAVGVIFDEPGESDPGPYPIPPNPPIEAGSDRHILIVQQGSCKLYELYAAEQQGGSWHAFSGAIFDLRSNALRPDTWTSADAAGLPILPGLVRRDEVLAGEINHALRFTAARTRGSYIWPARHEASSITDLNVPPMGQRFRLKASFDISSYPAYAQVILRALKKYGMILADNGSNWYVSGTTDTSWDDDALNTLKQLRGSDFEAVDQSSLQIDADSGQAKQLAEDGKSVTPGGAAQGQQATYTIQIVGDGAAASLSDPLPIGLSLASGPATTPSSVPAATYDGATRTIAWAGSPAEAVIVRISYTVTVESATTGLIANTASVTHAGAPKDLTAVLVANPLQNFLPALRR